MVMVFDPEMSKQTVRGADAFSAKHLFVHLFSGASNSKDMTLFTTNGRVAQRITRPPTERKIAGSSPAVLGQIFLQVFAINDSHLYPFLEAI